MGHGRSCAWSANSPLSFRTGRQGLTPDRLDSFLLVQLERDAPRKVARPDARPRSTATADGMRAQRVEAIKCVAEDRNGPSVRVSVGIRVRLSSDACARAGC